VVDSHCHVADPAFGADLDAVIARAHAAGVTDGLCVLAAGDAAEAAQADRAVQLWPTLRFAVGVHPHQAHQFAGRVGDLGGLLQSAIAGRPGVRAVGEIGLDYHYDLSPRDVQRAVFRAQVAWARETSLPVVIHTREADADTVAILEEAGGGGLAGVFHCFSGSAALARRALGLGFLVSFSGIVTFPRAGSLRDVAATVPLDRLLVETDCPYLAPVPMRGRRNEPAWVVRVAERLAEVAGVSLADLDRQVTTNFVRLVGP
jgi:TatD DNase family protein